MSWNLSGCLLKKHQDGSYFANGKSVVGSVADEKDDHEYLAIAATSEDDPPHISQVQFLYLLQ